MQEILPKDEFTSFKKKLGNKIQDLRKQKGITQEKLAEKINIDRVSVGYIEQGQRAPKLSTLLAISKILEVDVKTFFE